MLGYGMTELSPGSHVNPRRQTRPETVGVVLPNTQFKVSINENVEIPEIISCSKTNLWTAFIEIKQLLNCVK